jgi:UDP-2-acetamido-3-amino-2,3-dideoxy-glucuronate N-acetyltransferase
MNYKVHTTSDVQTAQIGRGTIIWQYCVILDGAIIGNHCNINYNVFIENEVVIGNNVTVKCGVCLWNGIIVEDNVQIGPNVAFTNDLFPRAKKSFNLLKTKVEVGASIGANATIIGGITIGQYAMIGAGSVVTKNIPNNTLWVGNPARQKGFVCNCGQKLNQDLLCISCGLQYKFDNYIMLND